MVVKEVSETGEAQDPRTPSSPPPILIPIVPEVDFSDLPATQVLPGSTFVPNSYLQVEPKQVLGCVVFREADNLAVVANWMEPGGQVQVKNTSLVSGNWTQIYTFVSGQVYVSGSTGPGDVLVGTTPISGLGASGNYLSLTQQFKGPLVFRLVSGAVAISGMILRDVRVGVIPVY